MNTYVKILNIVSSHMSSDNKANSGQISVRSQITMIMNYNDKCYDIQIDSNITTKPEVVRWSSAPKGWPTKTSDSHAHNIKIIFAKESHK